MIGTRIPDYAALGAPLEQPFVCRDLLSVKDFSPEEIKHLFDLTTIIKNRPADLRGALAGKQLVMFFEKPSLRTRLTFEAFFFQAEDGIRDDLVTGVQTCALPI